MPELPEVETFVRSLKFGGMTGEPVLDRKISSAALLWQRTLASSDAGDEFLSWFQEKTIRDVTRRGKYIILQIPPKYLLIHLRMSGDIKVDDGGSLTEKHTRFLMKFEDGTRMQFIDTRKFGRIWLTDDPESVVHKLGIEPLGEVFTSDWLTAKIAHSPRMIKPFLLDQSIIAGLGNIYTDESLFMAGIHPKRKAQSLSAGEAEKLVNTIRQVLAEGIRLNGASIDWVYRGGQFQNHFMVYQRAGQKCPHCGALIQKTTVGQRGTHFCPVCQPE